MFSFISAWINGWVNDREAGDLRRNRAHYDVIITNNKLPFQGLVCDFKHTVAPRFIDIPISHITNGTSAGIA